jgi:beta-lactam-binding protein with PASTA domain
MSFRKYLFSRAFILQVIAAVGILAVLVYFFFFWMTYITKHGEEITVPNLTKLNEEQVEDKLDELNLEYELLDTIDYKPDFPKLAVIQQDPLPGSKVKSGRTIYIKINAEYYKKVTVPDLVDKTYRQAVPTLKSIGLKEGTISYAPHIAKDMVLEMRFNGKRIGAGTKLYKASKVDLILGDGEVIFDESEIDSLMRILPEPEILEEDQEGVTKPKDTTSKGE